VNKARCEGEMLDILDASFVTETNVRISTSQEASQADVIIITAGAKQNVGEKRDSLLSRNVNILKSVRTDSHAPKQL
jgi:L-lactate dehydrogenase